MRELQGKSRGFRGTKFAQTDPDCGQFVDDRSAIGTWVVGDDEPLVVETIAGSQLSIAAGRRRELKPLVTLGPDVVVVARPGLRHEGAVRILAIWASLRLPGSDWYDIFEAWVCGLLQNSHPSFPKEIVTPVLFVPAPGNKDDDAIPARISK